MVIWFFSSSTAAPSEGPPAGVQESRGLRELMEAGTSYLQERKYHQAIQCFERAYTLHPEMESVRQGLARALAGLGVEFTNSGEPGQAREAFERALRFDEDQVARFGLGYLYFLEQKDKSARDNLERSLSKKADDPSAYKLIALIDYRQGDTASALKFIKRAVKLDPKDREAEAFLKRWSAEEKLSGSLKESGTRHFLVRYGRGIHPEAIREILTSLEEIYDSVGQALGHWPRKKIPVLLLSQAEFYNATGSFHWVGGVYDGQIKIPVKPEEGQTEVDRPTLLRTLRHEYTHAVVKELCPGCPNWLNEGIAQYFELPENVKSLRDQRNQETVKRLLQIQDRRIPLERIPPRMWEISDQSFARLTYLEGLGFVSYLVETHRTFRLRLLLTTYCREGSLNRAFKITYGATLGELEVRWWRFLSKSTVEK